MGSKGEGERRLLQLLPLCKDIHTLCSSKDANMQCLPSAVIVATCSAGIIYKQPVIAGNSCANQQMGIAPAAAVQEPT